MIYFQDEKIFNKIRVKRKSLCLPHYRPGQWLLVGKLSDLKISILCLQGITECFWIRPNHKGQGRPRHTLGMPQVYAETAPKVQANRASLGSEVQHQEAQIRESVSMQFLSASVCNPCRPHSCRSLCLTVELSEQRWTKRVPAAVRARSSWSS